MSFKKALLVGPLIMAMLIAVGSTIWAAIWAVMYAWDWAEQYHYRDYIGMILLIWFMFSIFVYIVTNGDPYEGERE